MTHEPERFCPESDHLDALKSYERFYACLTALLWIVALAFVVALAWAVRG